MRIICKALRRLRTADNLQGGCGEILCPVSHRREDIVKGLAGLKELWVKKARQVPALGSIHQCLSLVQQKYHSRGCDESMCSAALTTTLAPSGAANCAPPDVWTKIAQRGRQETEQCEWRVLIPQ
jgi:hypothetical protein